MRTMIIEDDMATAILLTMMLEEMGMEVCGAEATEAGAISVAATSLPDLIIVDVNLRIGTGIAAVREILLHRYVPIVFVSADLTQLRSENPQAIMLQKPYVHDQMVEAIERAVAIPFPIAVH